LLAAHADPDGRGYKAYARHWAALEQARAHGKRAVNSLVLAGKDFDAADETDHREPFAPRDPRRPRPRRPVTYSAATP
jgi:hypothetical protein